LRDTYVGISAMHRKPPKTAESYRSRTYLEVFILAHEIRAIENLDERVDAEHIESARDRQQPTAAAGVDAAKKPSGVTVSHAPPSRRIIIASRAPLSWSQIPTVPSRHPEKTRRPSRDNAIDVTSAAWPRKV